MGRGRRHLLVIAALLGNVLICGAQFFLPVGGSQGQTTRPDAVAASSDGLVVVGFFYPVAGKPPHAFRWVAGDTKFTDLGTLNGAPDSAATAVSADGSVVVGYSGTRAFRWAANDPKGITDLNTIPNGNYAYASAVSADGSVVVGWGDAGSPGVMHAFRWRVGDSYLEDLQGPDLSSSQATSVSSDGQTIVGFGTTLTGHNEGLVWPGGASIPTALQPVPGETDSTAGAVAASGSAVLGVSLQTADLILWPIASGGIPGVPQDLQMPALGTNPIPYVISADGTVVVDTAVDSAGFLEATRWTAGSIEFLGTRANPGGGSYSTAVSADGSVVVGVGGIESEVVAGGFYWSVANPAMQSIQTDLGVPIPADWYSSIPVFVSADGLRIVLEGAVLGIGPQAGLAGLIPIMFNLSPGSAPVPVGSGSLILTINGYGFPIDATVYFNGVQEPTTVGVNSLSATIPSGALTLGNNQNLNTVQVTVRDSKGVVGSLPFTILNSTVGPVQSQNALPGQTVAVTAPTTAGAPPAMTAVLNNPAGGSPVTVSAATYSSVPSVGTVFSVGTTFVDLQVSGASANGSMTATFYSAMANDTLAYWNGTTWINVLSSGGVTPVWVTPAGSTISAATVILDGTSTPPITALTGTPFAVAVPASASQTITFGPVDAQVYGDLPLDLSATASSGLPVSFAVSSGPGVLNDNKLTLTGPGTVVVVASQAGNTIFGPALSVTRNITVAKQPASSAYTGASLAWTASEMSSSATVTLAATIKGFDSLGGDIRNAKVSFVDRGSSVTLASGLPVGLVSASDTTVGTATFNWSVTLPPGAPSQSYTIGIIVSGYYADDKSAEDAVVTVSRPITSAFVTGGGDLVLSSSGGLKAGDAGTRNNFGFNLKYNQSGTSLHGSFNSLIRRTESDGVLHVYQVKGNSMTSMSANPMPTPTTLRPSTATFDAKASIQDITNPQNVISIDGNATLQVSLTDTGSAASDTIAITVWNKSGGLWFSSDWNGTTTVQQALEEGDLSVH
jgi:probable HAF family extracellular repeat protein